MSNKITTTTHYDGEPYKYVCESHGIRLFESDINSDNNIILVNSDDEVIFEVFAECSQNVGILNWSFPK